MIQVLGIIMGFLSIYLVAGDMGPATYSLVGVYGVVFGIILPFSHLGIETTMMREALYWEEKGDVEKLKEYTTQAILSRLIGFVFLLPIVVAYLLFMYFTKYNCQHLWVLLSFYIGACGSALNDSLSLIVRSQGNYVFSQAAKTFNNAAVKVIAILIYLKFGATPYLLMFSILPWPLFMVFFFKLRKYIDFRYINFIGTFRKIKDARYLWLKTYVDFFSKNADNLLVSIIFPSSILGLYALYKNLEGIAVNFIEGFFDVIIQKMVKFKGDVKKLMKMEKKDNIIRWGVIILVVIFTLIFSLDTTFFVNIANLSKYDGVVYSIYTVALVAILYLVGKNEINIVALMGPSKTLLKLGILLFFVSVLSYISVIIWQSIFGVYIQRAFLYLTTSLFSIYLLHKNRLKYYSNIYQ